LEWKEEYSLGIQEIDDQHQALLHSFTEIEQAINSRQKWSNTHYSIVALKEFALMHFAFEEALMRLFGYPETDDHRSTHVRFLATIEDILNSSIRRSADQEMLALLHEWLTKHILGSDKQYARYILAGASVVRSDTA
jgi:hemerythrin